MDLVMVHDILAVVLVAIGIAAIPIVVKLAADLVKTQIDEKTLFLIQELVQAAVEAAECLFPDGEEKRRYVHDIVAEAAKALKFKLSDAALEKIVDMLLEASVFRTFAYPRLLIAKRDD